MPKEGNETINCEKLDCMHIACHGYLVERTDILIDSIPLYRWKDILRECLIEKGLPSDFVERFNLWQLHNPMDERIKIQMAFDGKKLDTYYIIDPYQFVYVLRQVVDFVQNDILKPTKPVKRKRAKVTITSRFRPKVNYKPSWEH